MQLPALAADPLGQVDRGLVLAPLADHERTTSEGVETRRCRTTRRDDIRRHRPCSCSIALDLVTQPRGCLVVFGGHRPLQLVAKLDQRRLLLRVPRGPLGHLAGMPGLSVDVLEQRHQLVAEDLVIVGTTQPARIAEFEERDLADRANLLVGRRRLPQGARRADDQLLGQLADRRRSGDSSGAPGAAGRARRRNGTRDASLSRRCR